MLASPARSGSRGSACAKLPIKPKVSLVDFPTSLWVIFAVLCNQRPYRDTVQATINIIQLRIYLHSLNCALT